MLSNEQILEIAKKHAKNLFPPSMGLSDHEIYCYTNNVAKGIEIGMQYYIEKQSLNSKLIEALKNINDICGGVDCTSVQNMKEVIQLTLEWSFNALSASQNTVSKECDSPCGMNYCDENGCSNRKRNLVGLDELIESLKENTVSNEGEKWVSVDDRLPEAYETIISYNIHTDEVSTDYIDDEKRWDVLNPTHWMPLPQAPKEK